MTVPFTEPVQNFTEFSLWEILDIKKANFSVTSFNELDEAYSETPLKFAERTIVQLGSTPKRIRYYDENGDFTEDNYYPSNEPQPYRDAAVMDKVATIAFDQDKEATLDGPEDIRYEMSDGAHRLYNSGELSVYLDSSKPIGAIQFENLANYHWDYPEIVVKLYVDNEQTYLGGFRVPYGFGVVFKYNLDNKEELNLSKGYWTWSMFVVDWSVIQKVATGQGQFASLETAYLGLFGDEGEGDERVYYPTLMKQDENGNSQFEFTGDLSITYKDKDTGGVESESVMTITKDGASYNKPIQGKGELNTLEVSYHGEYGDDASYKSVKLSQDNNGWTQFAFTGNMQFKAKNKNTGVVGDNIFELRSDRVVHNKQPYYGNDKLATRTNNNIANTASFNDLIHSSGQNINEWIADNEGYTSVELLDAIFDSKVLGSTNWICSATTSGNDYNGTFPTSYQQVEIHKTGGSARNFMRAYNKESTTHYFSPYKSGNGPDWKTYTYKEEIPGLVDIELEPLEERVSNLESGDGADKTHVDSEFKFKESPEDGYAQNISNLTYEDKTLNGQTISVAQVPDKTKGALAFAIVKKGEGRVWMGFHADVVADLVGTELMAKRPNLGIVLDGSKFNVCSITNDTPPTGIMNWEGYCIPKGMDANDDNPSRYIMPDGSQTTVKADAFTRNYMGWTYEQKDTFKHGDTLFVEDWKFRLSRGYIAENNVFIPDDDSPYYFCRIGMEYTLTNNRVVTLSFQPGTFSIYQSPRGAIADREKVVTGGELAAYQQPDRKGFINDSVVNVDFPVGASGSQYRPNNVVVMVLKTDSLINGLNVSVVGGDCTGDYNAIGPVFRDEHGEWAQGGKRNAYRINTGEDTYCVFDVSLASWVLIKTDTDHNHTGQQTGGDPINLYNDGQLPDPYGYYTITNTLDSIESQYFKEVVAPITYNETSFIVDFGTHELAGIIFYK